MEKTEGKPQNMGVQLLSHARQRLLSDPGLEQGYQVLESACQQHRRKIGGAVPQKQVHLLEADGLVDDPFLHFEREHPRAHRNQYHQQQHGLEL